MYFSSKIQVIPDVGIKTIRIAPSHAFGKILHVLSAGLSSPKELKLAFTAVSILQNINRAFRAKGINNIVRLAKDGHDFYFDDAGKQDDLSDAVQTFNIKHDQLESELFNDLYLVVEHEQDSLKYLIEVDINRTPAKSQAPIVISVNAIVMDFKQLAGESHAELKQKLKPIFASSEMYNNFVADKAILFEQFVDELKLSLRSALKIKQITSAQSKSIVRRASENNYAPRNRRNSSLIHQGYYGYDDYCLYTWHWLDLCYEHQIQLYDTDLVSDEEVILWSVDSNGINASENVFFDMQQNYDSVAAQSTNDVQSSGQGNSTSSSVVAASVAGAYITSEVIQEDTSNSSWLSGIFSDSDSPSDSGSRCSSCSSCGGD